MGKAMGMDFQQEDFVEGLLASNAAGGDGKTVENRLVASRNGLFYVMYPLWLNTDLLSPSG